jgi:hypothetical protein
MLASKELRPANPIQVSFISKNDFFGLKMLPVEYFAQDKGLFKAFWIT